MIYNYFLIIFLICLINLSDYSYARTSETLKVQLSHGGILVGRYLVSHDGNGIRAFLGIPYAEKPINELRFKPPVPVLSWIGELKANEDPNICTQRDSFRRDELIEGSEDCLYLNVYAPQFPVSNKPLAVMVFFHGGGWQCGAGVRMFYGPDYLLDHDIIYVGANFRLGPLGFLSTEQEDCPGNNGLKDQVQVLKWIQENIHSFGGDPNRVTVFGESAGGASATYHMMSPLSKGLFQQAISQSGTNLDPWAQPAHRGIAQKRAERLGKLLDCEKQGNNWKLMIECLRTKSAEKITEAYYDFFEFDTDPMIPFPPVVEMDLPGAFITEHPREVKNPWGLSLPFLTGITMDEGVMKSGTYFHKKELWNNINENWNNGLSIALYYNHHDKNKQKEITNKINEYYFNNKQLTQDTKQNFTNLFTDGWFLAGMEEYLRIRFSNEIKTKIGPTYIYLFAHKGQSSFTEIFQAGEENYYGVCHAEELQYLFPIGEELFTNSAPTKDDNEIRRILTKMWVNFAQFGNPTPNEESSKWLKAKAFPLDYLRIGNKDRFNRPLIEMEEGLMTERANFWTDLQAHYHSYTSSSSYCDEKSASCDENSASCDDLRYNEI